MMRPAGGSGRRCTRQLAGWAAQQRFLSTVFGGGYADKSVRWSFSCTSGHDYEFSKNVRLE